MNKEFKKLLEQSYTKGFEECARTGHKVGDLDVIFNSIVMGEFAELIVQECAGVCAGIAAVRAGYNDVDGRDTAYSCGDTIKEYFGVE